MEGIVLRIGWIIVLSGVLGGFVFFTIQKYSFRTKKRLLLLAGVVIVVCDFVLVTNCAISLIKPKICTFTGELIEIRRDGGGAFPFERNYVFLNDGEENILSYSSLLIDLLDCQTLEIGEPYVVTYELRQKYILQVIDK